MRISIRIISAVLVVLAGASAFSACSPRGQSGQADDPRLRRLFGRALQLSSEKRLDEAEAVYAELLELRPDNYPAFTNLIRLHLQQDDAAGALAVIETVLPRAGDAPQLHTFSGLVNDHLGRAGEAVPYYERALELQRESLAGMSGKPQLARAHANIAFLLVMLGRGDEAAAELDRAAGNVEGSDPVADFIESVRTMDKPALVARILAGQ